MQVVRLTGTGRERGRAYGQAASQDIHDAARALADHLSSAGHDPQALAERLASGPLAAAARRHTPDLWDEVEAMAQSSGAGLPAVCLLSFLDEVWGMTGCSVIARRTSTGTQIGQTMDLPAWTRGRLVVLQVQPSPGDVQLVMSYPGDIGLCGASPTLSVAVNALEQFGMDESGVGVAFIIRTLLTLPSVDDVEPFLASVPHAAGQAYTVADATTIATFEAGPGVLRRVSTTDAAACLHTNHPLDMEVAPDRSTTLRLASLQRSVAKAESVEDALSGDVVLDGTRYRDPNLTFAAFARDSGDDAVRFIDGIDLRDGRPWTRITFP